MNRVTVIGLGAMGVTLARLLLKAGYAVTVWNRTPEKADALVAAGAALAPDAASAVTASPVTVVCVHDYRATEAILAPTEDAVKGRVLIQLTTGSPQDGRDLAAWVQARGGSSLDGAIQAAPDQMGDAATAILLSGPKDVYERNAALLKTFGGNLIYLGEDAGAASAMDFATLSALYGVLVGFFQGALISEAEGFRVDEYARIVAETLPAFAEFLKHEGNMIHRGDFAISQSPMSINVEATERIARSARDAGIDDEFPTYVAGLFRRAADKGYGNEELAALIKVMRK
ncbi:MAG: NAD(P)-dependent oxidoreductase [Fimbriimonas sp.]